MKLRPRNVGKDKISPAKIMVNGLTMLKLKKLYIIGEDHQKHVTDLTLVYIVGGLLSSGDSANLFHNKKPLKKRV